MSLSSWGPAFPPRYRRRLLPAPSGPLLLDIMGPRSRDATHLSTRREVAQTCVREAGSCRSTRLLASAAPYSVRRARGSDMRVLQGAVAAIAVCLLLGGLPGRRQEPRPGRPRRRRRRPATTRPRRRPPPTGPAITGRHLHAARPRGLDVRQGLQHRLHRPVHQPRRASNERMYVAELSGEVRPAGRGRQGQLHGLRHHRHQAQARRRRRAWPANRRTTSRRTAGTACSPRSSA